MKTTKEQREKWRGLYVNNLNEKAWWHDDLRARRQRGG